MKSSKREQRKKEGEERYAHWFIDNVNSNDLRSCELIWDEEPDFGVKCGEKKIGLEITNFFRNVKGERESANKEIESLRQEWLSKDSAKKYYDISAFPLMVQARIRLGELDRKPKALTAQELACELAKRSNIEFWEKTDFDFNATDKCVLKISMTRLPDECEGYSRWTFVDNSVGWSREIGETEKEKIQKIICKKAKKLSKYKEKYPEIILLIVSDKTSESGMIHAVDRDLVVNSCGFSSVYLALYPQQNEIIRIA